MATTSSNLDGPNEDTGTDTSGADDSCRNGPDSSPASKIVIPETPSPSMPQKRPHQSADFDIAGQVFTTPPKLKGTKKKLVKVFHPTVSTATSNRMSTLSSKVKLLSSTSGANSSCAFNDGLMKHRMLSEKQGASKKATTSSSESEEDEIPLLQRIQKKRKLDRQNGLLHSNHKISGLPSVKKVVNSQGEVHTASSEKHNKQTDFLLSYGSNNKISNSHSKRIKLKSSNKECNRKSSDAKVKTSQLLPHSVHEKLDSQRSSVPKTGTSQSGVCDSDPGPSSGKESKVKKTSPGNTVRDSKNNVIQKRIKDLFGTDSESDGDTLTVKKQTQKQGLLPNQRSSGHDNNVMKKTVRKNIKKDVQQHPKKQSVHQANQSNNSSDKRGEASARSSHQSTSTGSDSNRNKRKHKSKHNAILSDDSSDTDVEISLLTSRPVGRSKCNKMKQTERHRVKPGNRLDSGNSDVEMVSPQTPPISPVFNRGGDNILPQRSTTPVMRRCDDEEGSGGDENVSNSIAAANSRVSSRTSRVNRVVEDGTSSDSDVVPLDNEVELVPQASHRRRVCEGAQERRRNIFSDAFRRRLERTSELGTRLNLDNILRVTPPSSTDPWQLGPSFHHERRQRRPSNRGAGNQGERSRTASGRGSSAERRRRQLEADEQLARDLASGRIRTPKSSKKVVRGSGSTGRRNRQVAEDEALARELASGNIRTPVGQGPSQQIDDDEALARQLQEQFNAEASQEERHEDSDEADTTNHTLSINVPGQHPFTFHYEMGVSSFPRPYPTLSISPIMSPVILGEPPDEPPAPPRTRSRTRGRGRGRGRGRRGRNTGGVHIQFFPMNMDETLEDDYESLWELADRVGPAVQQGLTAEVLSLLPTFTYKASAERTGGGRGDEEQSKNCTICMMDYEEGENLRRLPCFHDYHTACIDRWLAENSACPVCQTRVTLDEPIIE